MSNTVLMIRPENFSEIDFCNNYDGKHREHKSKELLNLIEQEFQNLVLKIKELGVKVIVNNCKDEHSNSNTIFSNHWISFHKGGDVVIYPVFDKKTRLGRNKTVLESIENHGFLIESIIDYSVAEEEGCFLEGMNSVVLDRVYRKAYCALSERSNEELFIEFCEDLDYFPVLFKANYTDENNSIVQYTSMVLFVASKFVIVCLDVVKDKSGRKELLRHLKSTKRQVIAISEEQMNAFVTNAFEVFQGVNDSYLIMSEFAYSLLNRDQIVQIEKFTKIIKLNIHTIEANLGLGLTAILSEVFLDEK